MSAPLPTIVAALLVAGVGATDLRPPVGQEPGRLPSVAMPAEPRRQPQWNTPALQRLMHEWDVKLEKMELHLQPAMRRAGVDMWIIMPQVV